MWLVGNTDFSIRRKLGAKSVKMDWRYNTIWFDQIDAGKVATFNCNESKPNCFGSLEYITIWHYRQPNQSLDGLPASTVVLYLDLSLGGTKSLVGIGRLNSLRRLEIHHCTKLESDLGIAEVCDTLKHLHVSTCRKFTIRGDLFSLKKLEVLRLNNCGDIEDIDFIQCFPNLIDFRFVGTNVKSGDLSPLLAHKNLRSVGFFNKRHYNLKPEDVDAELAAKWPASCKEFVTKGQWETFKYIDSKL